MTNSNLLKIYSQPQNFEIKDLRIEFRKKSQKSKKGKYVILTSYDVRTLKRQELRDEASDKTLK